MTKNLVKTQSYVSSKNYKENKGITLIALVITIIVLLILSGVAISMISGDNGILKQAARAKETTEDTSILENIQLAELASRMKDGEVNFSILKEELNKTFGENGYSINPDNENAENGWEVELKGKGIKYHIDANDGYIRDKLLLYLDGINNTRNGHNEDSTLWEDLSGNEKDVELRDFSYNAENGVYLGDKIKDLLKDDFTIEMILNCGEDNSRDILIGNYGQPYGFNIERLALTNGYNNNLRLYINNYFDYHTKIVCSIQQTMHICLTLDKENNTVNFFKNVEFEDTYTNSKLSTYNYDFSEVWLRKR